MSLPSSGRALCLLLAFLALVASALAGFATVAALMLAGLAIARRWTR